MKKENNNIDGFCRFIVEFNVKSMKDGTLSVFERKKNQKQHEFLVISIELLVIPIEFAFDIAEFARDVHWTRTKRPFFCAEDNEAEEEK